MCAPNDRIRTHIPNRNARQQAIDSTDFPLPENKSYPVFFCYPSDMNFKFSLNCHNETLKMAKLLCYFGTWEVIPTQYGQQISWNSQQGGKRAWEKNVYARKKSAHSSHNLSVMFSVQCTYHTGRVIPCSANPRSIHNTTYIRRKHQTFIRKTT